MPATASDWPYAASGQFSRDLSDRHPRVRKGLQDRCQRPRTFDCRGLVGRRKTFNPIATQPHSTGFCSLQSSLCADGDHFTLVLGDSREDVQGQTSGMGIIAGNKLDARVHHRGDEGHVT